jgi:hypothetical protein
MSKLILKSEIIDYIPLCDNLEFLKRFEKKIHPRLMWVIHLRHGHTVFGKLEFAKMKPYIRRIDSRGEGQLSARHLSKLYYIALKKIKGLIENEHG